MPRLRKIEAILNNPEVKAAIERHSEIEGYPDGSPQLAEFFGETKITVKDGKHQPQYHYASAVFDEFNTPEDSLGTHVGTQKAAFDRGMAKTEGKVENATGAVTMALHVRAETPVMMPDMHSWHPHTVAKELLVRGYITQADITQLQKDTAGGDLTNAAIKKLLQKKGWDSIAYINQHEGKRKLTDEEADARINEAEFQPNPSDPSIVIIIDTHTRTVLGLHVTGSQQ